MAVHRQSRADKFLAGDFRRRWTAQIRIAQPSGIGSRALFRFPADGAAVEWIICGSIAIGVGLTRHVVRLASLPIHLNGHGSHRRAILIQRGVVDVMVSRRLALILILRRDDLPIHVARREIGNRRNRKLHCSQARVPLHGDRLTSAGIRSRWDRCCALGLERRRNPYRAALRKMELDRIAQRYAVVIEHLHPIIASVGHRDGYSDKLEHT